jgi:hypothetical protein
MNVFYLFLKKIERHAAQAPALRERFHPSTFNIRHSIFCGSLFDPNALNHHNEHNLLNDLNDPNHLNHQNEALNSEPLNAY